MAEIVNLRRARKDKARRDQEREAETNRLRFGRTKAKKRTDEDARECAERAVEDRKLDE